MLVSSFDMLREAQASGYAVGAFNTYNLEITTGIIRGAEDLHAPIILQVGASALDYGGPPLIDLVLSAAHQAAVPVAVHLDHARDMEVVRLCLEAGFTSFMFDGSMLSLEKNVVFTCQAAEIVHTAGYSLEGELGAVSGKEDDAVGLKPVLPYTEPDEAAVFVEQSHVDILAVAIGNVHGLYQQEPNLDFERLKAIRERVAVPLALHGASGIPDADLRQAIEYGICKINVNTDLRRAFFDTISTPIQNKRAGYNLPLIFAPGIEAVKREVICKIGLFGSAEHA